MRELGAQAILPVMAASLPPAYEELARLVASGRDWREAVVEAGIRHPTWRVLCRDPDVRARVAQLQAEMAARAVAPDPVSPSASPSATLTVNDLRAIFEGQGTFDPAVFEGVNSLAELRERVPEHLRRLLVKGWRYDKQGNFVLELCDKDTALDRLARHHGFYNDKLNVQHTGFEALLRAAEAALQG